MQCLSQEGKHRRFQNCVPTLLPHHNVTLRLCCQHGPSSEKARPAEETSMFKILGSYSGIKHVYGNSLLLFCDVDAKSRCSSAITPH